MGIEERLSLYERGVQIFKKIQEEKENARKAKEERILKKELKIKEKIIKKQQIEEQKKVNEIKKDAELQNQKIFEEQKNKRLKGTVKWFNPNKGYGFIEREDGKKDIFVHISAVNNAGLKTLKSDEVVTFEVEINEKGETSINLQKIS